jgi:hypothetical protein
MATVTSYTKAKIDQLIDQTIVDADIIAEELVFTKEDGSTINLGAVGGGLDKVTSFPIGAVDGDTVVRIDLPGDPIYKRTDGVWELQPRMGAANVPTVKALLGADQSIPHNTATLCTLASEDWDTDAIHDTVTNNTRLVIKTPGRYLIDASAVFAASSAGTLRYLFIYKNGTSVKIQTQPQMSTAGTRVNTSAILTLAAGDYVEMGVQQDTGSPLNIVGTGTNQSYLAATWLGGAGQTVDERGVPACRATAAGSLNVPTTTETLISFDAEDFDTDGMHDTAVNNTRFVAKTPGLYRFTATHVWGATSGGYREAYFKKNGVTLGSLGATDNTPPTTNFWQQVTAEIMLAAGDYVELTLWQNSGGTATVGSRGMSVSMVASGKTVTPFARVYKTASTQSVPDGGVDTALTFDAEESDNDGIHDTVTNNTRFTCRTAGVYAIHANVTFASNSSGARWLQIRKNGSTHIEQRIVNGTGDSRDTAVEISCLAELAVGDYLEVVVTVTGAGGSLTLTGGQNGRGNKFEMVKIGAPLAGQTGIGPAQADVFTVATLPAANTFPNGRIVGVSDGAVGQQARMAMNGAWINLG